MATITVKQAGGGDHLTIALGLAAIGTSAGAGADDIVEVYDGTYEEDILNTLPSGTSWSHPFRLQVAASNTATIKNTGENNIRVYEPVSQSFYSIITGFIFDGTNLTSNQIGFNAAESGPSSIRIDDCEFINTENENAIYVGGYSSDIQLMSLHIHGGAFTTTSNGAGKCHGIYYSGSDGLIEDCELNDITGYGIHMYASNTPFPSNNIVRSNTVYDVATETHVAAGILITSGSGNHCYQNVVYDVEGLNGNGGVGITVSGTNNQAYNNTVYSCSWIGLDAQGSSGAILKNNIAYLNGSNTDFTGANGGGVPTGLVQTNNLVGINPLFTNAGAADFTLQSGSPAINYGVYVGLSFAGSAPDAGAFEFAQAAVPTGPVHVGSTMIMGGRMGMR